MGLRSPKSFLKGYMPIEPDAYAAGTKTSAGIDTIGFRYLFVQLNLGDLGTNATVDVKLQESDNIGINFVDIASGTFAQATQAGTDFSNTTHSCQVALGGRKRYIRVVGVVATATSDYGVSAALCGPTQGQSDITRDAVASECECETAYALSV